VKGVPVTQFCDEHRLTVEERLALFREACLAIQHAHQKGIIHRDIKPSNILTAMVDDRPVLKVIDFGIAKATQQPLTDKTLHTRMEQFMGTPDYMSPEQASGGELDIDTRSDIYALGVLLYELLTGSPPFNRSSLLKAGEQEIRRLICEVEPPKPSTRLGSLTAEETARLAQSRQLEPSRLKPLVRGDLDWIVMRALEKDRSRRYDSANGLAEDIQLFLSHKPVSASPPGTGYVLRKFARRHRLALGAAAAVIAALITGLTVSTWMFFEQKETAKREQAANAVATRRLAESEAARREARTLTTFLLDIMKSPYPADQGRPITMRSILEKAERQLPVVFKDRPEDRAIMEEAIAMSYDTIGSSGMGVPLLFKASNYVRRHPDYGPEHERSRRLQAQLALLYSHAGDHFNARTLMEAALKWERRLDPRSPMAVQREIDLAECYFAADSFEEARVLLVSARPFFATVLGEKSADTLRGLTLLCKTYLRLGQYKEALEAGEKALEFAPDDIASADKGLIQNMVQVQIAEGNLGKAEQLAKNLWELRKPNGEKNFYTLLAAMELGNVHELQKRRDDAIKHWQIALSDPATVSAYGGVSYKLGEALFIKERDEEALAAFSGVREGALPPELMAEMTRMVKVCRERLAKTNRDRASGEPSPTGSPNETK
jgi:tetratricopeptide (TPR) repeat protein